jgi:hypothetical protein
MLACLGFGARGLVPDRPRAAACLALAMVAAQFAILLTK